MTVEADTPEGSAEPIDLLLRVKNRQVEGSVVLDYELTSPSGRLDFQTIEAKSERLRTADLKREHIRLFRKLERLLRQLDEDGELLLKADIEEEIRSLGHDLYLRLFPDSLKDFYREYRAQIRSLMVLSDEPWIPWELVRPDEFDDDDFLCMRFAMARWFAGPMSPAATIQIRRLLCVEAAEVEGYPSLLAARDERDRLVAWGEGVSGLDIDSLKSSTHTDLIDRLRKGGFDLLHFVGHADYDADEPDRSKLVLTDRPFQISKLTGGILRRIRENRPLVFLHACRSAREGLALTGIGGWPDRWVRFGHSALLSPQWAVRDRSAGIFADTFYHRLRAGATLGMAVLEARRNLRELDPTDPTYLAYSLYGHPNAIVGFGEEQSKHLSNGRQIEPPKAPRPTGTPRDSGHTRLPGLLPFSPHLVVGREDDLRKLEQLIGARPQEYALAAAGSRRIVMRGWPGVGKTTTAAALAHRRHVTEHFQAVLWTSLGQSPDLLEKFETWLRALSPKKTLLSRDLAEAVGRLRRQLEARRCLLIIDDVWKDEHAAPFLAASSPASTVLLTTRLTSVAQSLVTDGRLIYMLPVLSEADAVSLLEQLAPAAVERYPDEARQLANAVERLPLALRVAGPLIELESQMGWGLNNLLDELDEGRRMMAARAPYDYLDLEHEMLPTVAALLNKSTDLLDASSRAAYADLGAFAPKPATFDLRAIEAVCRLEDGKPFIRNLVSRGLMERTEPGRFQMHSLLVSHARFLCLQNGAPETLSPDHDDHGTSGQ